MTPRACASLFSSSSLVIAALLVLGTSALSACSGNANKGKTTTAQGDPKGEGTGEIDEADPIPYASSIPRPCMLHYQAGTYHECMAGADGQCFHYGALCTPESQCMFDAKESRYRHCETLGEGRCDAFGDACEPAAKCGFQVSDARYHECTSSSGGVCKAGEALCLPPVPSA